MTKDLTKRLLADHGPLTAHQIAQMLRVHLSTAKAALALLEASGAAKPVGAEPRTGPGRRKIMWGLA